MDSDRRTVKSKIQARQSDMSWQSSVESWSPPNEKGQNDPQSCRRHKANDDDEGTNLLQQSPKRKKRTHSSMSIRRHEEDNRLLRYTKKNYRFNRPEQLDLSIMNDSSSSSFFQPPPAPRHASESADTFFPSPRSVLERRTSSGSFF